MKRVRVEEWCDGCDEQGELVESVESVTVVLNGERVQSLDLCSAHLVEYVEPLAKLLASHGVTPEAQPANSKVVRAPKGEGAWKCPKCDMASTSRSGLLGHIMSRHDLDRVTASKIAPPIGPAEACAECGMVTTPGQGMFTHYSHTHAETKGTDRYGIGVEWTPAKPARKRASRAKAASK